MYTAAKCGWIFSIYNHESISEENIFVRFLITFFSSEIHFTNQRSNVYRKWSKWLRWDEHERRNEWKFKTYVWKENREKSERQIHKRKLESCGNG